MGHENLGNVRTQGSPAASPLSGYCGCSSGGCCGRPTVLELVFGPRPHLLDRREGCGPVESRWLVALVAELDRPGGENVGLGELLRSLDPVFFHKSDQIAQRMTLHERHAACGEDGLDQLLDGLLGMEADNRVGVSVSGETFRTSVSSSIALASSTRARSSRSCGGMKHSTLGESGVDHRALYPSPILGVVLAYDQDIERHPEWAERSTETDHLGVSVLRPALHDEEVEVAVRTSVTASTRAKEHDLDRIGSDSDQSPACHLDDLLRNHDDTVAKLPGGLCLAGSATIGCQRSAFLIASATCQRACRPTGSISASTSRSRVMSAFSRRPASPVLVGFELVVRIRPRRLPGRRAAQLHSERRVIEGRCGEYPLCACCRRRG